jgi:hypothetical protein
VEWSGAEWGENREGRGFAVCMCYLLLFEGSCHPLPWIVKRL